MENPTQAHHKIPYFNKCLSRMCYMTKSGYKVVK